VMTGPLLDLFLGKAPARERDAASV
jgi:hypothetical protein